MKRLHFATVIVLGCAVSAGLGYWAGFREAWSLGISADYLPRGVLATGEIKSLKAGKPENVFILLESEIDIGLIQGERVLDHPLRRLLNPLSGTDVYPEFEKYAVRLANYRKKNPSSMSPGQFEPSSKQSAEEQAVYRDIQSNIRDGVRTMDRMIERYATEK
jgi:hypothetical protein